MFEFVLPKLNNTDDRATVNHWYGEQGGTVSAGEPLVEVETSKAANELEAPASGVLHRLVEQGADARFGEPLALVFDSEDERRRYLAQEDRAPSAAPPAADLVITKAAQELIDRHGLTGDMLRGLGKQVIRASDLESLVSQEADPAPRLTKSQQGVARVVSLSHRTIPAAFTVIAVDLAALDTVQAEAAEQGAAVLGLAEHTVKALADLHGDHPLFFAALLDDERIALAETPHVGVTVDVGTGLSIPVVKDAAARTGQEVADLLEELRLDALEGTLRGESLTGGNITLSLNDAPDVVFAQPIVFPGQVCMVSVGGRQSSLALHDGRPVQRSLFHLGVAYDHRVVNGNDAVRFGRALKSLLEDPDRLRSVQAS